MPARRLAGSPDTHDRFDLADAENPIRRALRMNASSGNASWE